jgi:hypothetical protein
MARCQACRGVGLVEALVKPWLLDVIPCPECGGSGWEHCCEGLREQPSASDNSKSDARRRSFGM